MRSPYSWSDIEKIKQYPHLIGHLCGKTLLTPLHSDWMHWCLDHKEKHGLLGHRGSYKSTSITELGVIYCWMQDPEQTIAIVRKSYSLSAEMVREIMNIAESPPIYYLLMHCWYADANNNIPDSALKEPLFDMRKEGKLNLSIRTRHTKEASLTGLGLNGNFTGFHTDRLLIDDGTSYLDRVFDRERAFSIMMINELLSNILNRGCPASIIGSSWHREDALAVLENAGIPFRRYPYTVTGLLTDEQVEEARRTQTGALFDCNYLLTFTSTADMIFHDPHMGVWDSAHIKNVKALIDASYGGEDYTALCIAGDIPNGKINMVGYLYKGHIKDLLPEIFTKLAQYNCREVFMEDNADHGYTLDSLMADPRAKSYGIWGHSYRETMQKQKKIETYLYDRWNHIEWAKETEPEFLNQILDWTSTTKLHDDAADACASILREGSFTNCGDWKALWQ